MTDELWRLPAHRLAEMIARRETTSRAVVEAHLARIEAVNKRSNAITLVLTDSALAAADAADATPGTGALHGVPFTIKENIDVFGTPTTQGVPYFAHAMPTRDAPVVQRMKSAGAIPIGRTNLPELASRLSTDNPLHGRTLNPWNPSLTAGGSSGGDAVALATGMTPFGLGNDICGSLRNPAYCCGVVSLKPTAGRIPHFISIPPSDAGIASQLMFVQGPMARSIEDLRIGLKVLSGRDICDPVSVDALLQGTQPTLRRAALVTAVPGKALPASTVAAVREAGAVLSAAGWQVDEVQAPDIELINELWGRLLSADFLPALTMLAPAVSPPVYDLLSRLCHRFAELPPLHEDVHTIRHRILRGWSQLFADYPVLVGPVWAELPWPADADLEPSTGLDLMLSTARFITPANVLGLPAVALTTGMADGLPKGVQVYADLWREDLCLEAAAVIERGTTRVTPTDPA